MNNAERTKKYWQFSPEYFSGVFLGKDFIC